MTLELKDILLILHFVFLSFYLGGQIFYLTIIQPASYKLFSINDQIRFLQNILRKQNPILMLALCLVVLTGGFMITPIKASYQANYFSAFGAKLVVKLGYFFVVFLITAYQTLAVGFQIRFLDPAKDMKNLKTNLGKVRRNMTITCILNILVTAYVIYLARHL